MLPNQGQGPNLHVFKISKSFTSNIFWPRSLLTFDVPTAVHGLFKSAKAKFLTRMEFPPPCYCSMQTRFMEGKT